MTLYDYEADLIEARERADRELERADSSHLWLGPLDRCGECGYEPREVEPGRWICPCHEWSAA